jgi:copper homeostasis protein (lipoprotein)
MATILSELEQFKVIKRSLLVSAVLLSACTSVPEPKPAPVVVKPAEPVVVKPELVPDEVVHSDNAQPIATDFGLIFIERDMTFTGTLPCKKCPGVNYHVNIYPDGRFEARREFIDLNQIELIQGQWQLDERTIHFTSPKHSVPSFLFASNRHLTLMDNAGKPMVSAQNQTLTRQSEFTKLDSRVPLLGLYQLKDNQASFTDCRSGTSHQIAMTQHHMPMMRSYQTNPALNGKTVVATLTARKSSEQQETLLVDKFEQFWPGAHCPAEQGADKVEGIVWRLNSVSQIGVPQKLNIRVMFDQNNKVYGYAGCNNFNASYQKNDNQLKVLPLVMTRKHCTEANFYEQQFTRQLQLADRVEINQQKLQLLKDNQVIMEFSQAVN